MQFQVNRNKLAVGVLKKSNLNLHVRLYFVPLVLKINHVEGEINGTNVADREFFCF